MDEKMKVNVEMIKNDDKGLAARLKAFSTLMKVSGRSSEGRTEWQDSTSGKSMQEK